MYHPLVQTEHEDSKTLTNNRYIQQLEDREWEKRRYTHNQREINTRQKYTGTSKL